MTKKRSTKSALISSVLALFLCVSMLVGTTFAWFTDSVSSANNKIVAGNLDIELYYQNDETSDWTEVDENTNIFKKDTLWEPGHTEVVKFKIVNAGTLALKYQLGVNVASEQGSTNVEDNDFKLSEYIMYGIVEGEIEEAGREAAVKAVEKTATKLNAAYNSGTQTLYVDDTTTTDAKENEAIVTMVVYMPKTVGNEANAKKDAATPSINLGVNLVATQVEAEEDSFDNQYDAEAPILVANAEEAQEALDNLQDGATIQLMPGVSYGTLEVRAQVGTTKEGNKYVPISDNENTKPVDYFTEKYPTGEYTRTFNDITILGAPGAKVDEIKFVTGTFKATIPETGKTTGTMYQFVEINNLVIDGVEFTDKSTLGAGAGFVSPIFINLQSVKVNGLTVKNCKLEGDVSNMNFVYAYGNVAKGCEFGITLNDVVIENNTVDGIARLAELREANNVTIVGNTVSNLTRELALLANNTGKAYSGDIICSDNVVDAIAGDYVADGREGLFFRVGVGGDANIVVKNNVITNSNCVESSFVGVTGHTGTLTVEGNTLG